MQKIIAASYVNRNQADTAIHRLMSDGFDRSSIGLALSQATRDVQFGQRDLALEGAALGAGTGGVLGALVAGLTVTASLSVPGVGFLAAGPLVAALAGATTGVASGGALGALAGSGMSEKELHGLLGDIESGRLVVSVLTQTENEADIARRAFRDTGGVMHSTPASRTTRAKTAAVQAQATS